MYSRVAFYVGQAHWEYKSANPGKMCIRDRVYTDLCSFYFSVFDEHAVDMTLKEFVKLLRGERWKVQVEEYQRLKVYIPSEDG